MSPACVAFLAAALPPDSAAAVNALARGAPLPIGAAPLSRDVARFLRSLGVAHVDDAHAVLTSLGVAVAAELARTLKGRSR